MTEMVKTRKSGERPQGGTAISVGSAAAPVGDINKTIKAYEDSKQLPDPFREVFGSGSGIGAPDVISPALNPWTLTQLPDDNDTLKQCIAAVVTNVAGHGWCLDYVGPKGEQESEEALAEKEVLEDLLAHPNPEQSGTEVLERFVADLETAGYGTLEVSRDARGRIDAFWHVPAHTVRLTHRDPAAVMVAAPARPGASRRRPRRAPRRFRRFVQAVGSRKVWFREFGDPRIIDPETGRVVASAPATGAATEILHHCHYDAQTPYGKPRWVQQLPSVLGGREAENVNLDFFRNNAVPAMAILVSGGMVTQSTLDAIENHFTSVRGRASMQRILLIEAEGDEMAASPTGGIPAAKVDLKPLQGERQQDALFLEYGKACADKIRGAFRLPPLLVGQSQDYTYATARTSMVMAEGQVFRPERARLEELVNGKLLSTWGAKHWRFRLLGPDLADDATALEAVKVFAQVGALTPNVAIGLANRFFRLSIPSVAEEWGDYPFQVAMRLAEQGRLKGIDAIAKPMDELLRDAAAPGARDQSVSVADPGQLPGVEKADREMAGAGLAALVAVAKLAAAAGSATDEDEALAA
ncbi:hypothetical protein [Azospirillum argentinense]